MVTVICSQDPHFTLIPPLALSLLQFVATFHPDQVLNDQDLQILVQSIRLDGPPYSPMRTDGPWLTHDATIQSYDGHGLTRLNIVAW